MNQILSTEMNKNKKKTSKTVDIKKVIIFFSVAIVLFGLVILSKGVVSVYNNARNNVKVEQTEPEVSFSINDEGINLTVNHDKPIVKIIYKWNDGQEITVNGNNRTSITQNIALPEGTNILTVNITDEIHSTATIKKEFTKVESKLTLSFSRIGDKIKIVAEDTQELEYITYKWNNDPEEKEKADGRRRIEKEIPILKGLNTLTVVAKNKSGQTKTKTQNIEGIEEPKVSLDRDGEYIIITAKDENVLTLINYTLNNQPYRINLTAHDVDYYNAIDGLTVKTNQEGNIVEMEYRQLMTEKGNNIINVTVENKRGAQATCSGRCDNK